VGQAGLADHVHDLLGLAPDARAVPQAQDAARPVAPQRRVQGGPVRAARVQVVDLPEVRHLAADEVLEEVGGEGAEGPRREAQAGDVPGGEPAQDLGAELGRERAEDVGFGGRLHGPASRGRHCVILSAGRVFSVRETLQQLPEAGDLDGVCGQVLDRSVDCLIVD